MHEHDAWRVKFIRQYGQGQPQTLEGLMTFRYGASGTWAAHAALIHWTRRFGVPGDAGEYPIRYQAKAIRMKDGQEVVAGEAAAVRDSLDGGFLNENGVNVLDFTPEGSFIQTVNEWTEAERR